MADNAKEIRKPARVAGAVVWKKDEQDSLKILCVKETATGEWVLPKGRAKGKENPRETAVREVCEETGKHIALGRPLPTVHRPEKEGNKARTIYYWIATPLKEKNVISQNRPPVLLDDGSEIERCKWVKAEKALKKLEHRYEKNLVKQAIQWDQENELATSTVAIVRHARAKKRSAWDGNENTRPLTNQGKERTLAITQALGTYGITTLYSSPWARCMQTVEDYSTTHKVPILPVECITEKAHKTSPKKLHAFIHELIENVNPTHPTAVCMHRPTLGDVFESIKNHLPENCTFQAAIPGENPYLTTGEIFIAHIAQSNAEKGIKYVVSCEKFRPIQRKSKTKE